MLVGSGTINDLVKRAAFEINQDYLCVPTASSIDGYCSSGASLVKDDFKVTLECPPPIAVVADPEILTTAPSQMTCSGYGDLYAKLVAGIDWYIADRLNIEKIHQKAWGLIQDDLLDWLKNPEQVLESKSDTFHNLFKGLSYSGFAMQLYKDSRPASGAEHMISHVWEMEHLSKDGIPVSHGFKVALGTVITSSLMEKLFSLPPCEINVQQILRNRPTWNQRASLIREMFPLEPLQSTVIDVCRLKWIDSKELEIRLTMFKSILPAIKTLYAERLVSTDHVKKSIEESILPYFT